MDYPGKELEIFDTAKIFKKNVFLNIKKYLNDNVCEIGAGLGSFSRNYTNKFKNITLTDLDKNNYLALKKNFSNLKRVSIYQKKISSIKKKFNSIIYLNVLEHIKKDRKEISIASSKLKKNGYLIILVPAHQKLYTRFDKEIGHCRRYDINFFKKKIPNLKLEKLVYLDMVGYFLYFLNKIFFKEEAYPSNLKVFLWDKIFTPITILMDFLTGYKFGKNILCVYKKIK